MRKFYDKLISELVAIKGFAKDIHYTCHGEAFYSKHLFADLISELDVYIDAIKEVCLLGEFPDGDRPYYAKDYWELAKAIYPEISAEDSVNFSNLQKIIILALNEIEENKEIKAGAANVIGNVAEHLQKMNGLLNLQNL